MDQQGESPYVEDLINKIEVGWTNTQYDFTTETKWQTMLPALKKSALLRW